MDHNLHGPIEVTRVKDSKIGLIDFENLAFGSVFTDHMLSCEYRDGCWQTPRIEPYQPFMIDPSAKVFHYGQAIFEGMKAYRDGKDAIWLFRPDQNLERFNRSALRMAMPEIPESIFIDGLKELIKLDKAWVPKGEGNSLYIRPFMIAVGTGVMAAPATHYKFMIILSPAKAYYSGDVKVTIAQHYSRAANGGIGSAKAAGNYAAQFYPTRLANEQGYQQIIWTDDATHTQLEEAGTMNVFFRIGDRLLTAPVSERILDGVTRKSIIELAGREGIQVHEQPITVRELLDASAKGTLLEIFGTGTAAVVSPISGFSYSDIYYELPKVQESYSARLKDALTQLQNGSAPDPFGWRVKVC